MRKFFQHVNALSLDVAIGTVCSALFFAKVMRVNVQPLTLLVLGLSVWVIYTTDHLMDAVKIKKAASSLRHQFHQRHYRFLKRFVIMVSLITACLLFFIPKPVLLGGLFLSVLVIVYLFIHLYLKILKEVCIAILYTTGILLPLYDGSMSKLPGFLIIAFTLTALLNLIIFSWFDRHQDNADGNSSIITFVGEKNIMWWIYALFAGICVILLFAKFLIPAMLILMMSTIMIMIIHLPGYFAKNDRYRIWGDAIFFIPLIYVLI